MSSFPFGHSSQSSGSSGCLAINTNIGTAWGDLRDEMPKIARAEAMARAKITCKPIYKRRATLKGKQSPQTRLGPLALLCLLTPSLTSPCYNVFDGVEVVDDASDRMQCEAT